MEEAREDLSFSKGLKRGLMGGEGRAAVLTRGSESAAEMQCKQLQDGWQRTDPRTGAPVGIDKGWDYAPGASVARTITALSGNLDRLPEQPSIDLIQSWLTENLFGAWLNKPNGFWPLVRIPEARATEIGAKTTIAKLSAETAIKQLQMHPELSILDYAQAQRVVSEATEIIRDGRRVLIFVLDPSDANGHVMVVKATVSGNDLFIISFRRISADMAVRERTLSRLRQKEK